MLALLQQEYVFIPLLIGLAIIGMIGWGRFRRWLFRKRKAGEETA